MLGLGRLQVGCYDKVRRLTTNQLDGRARTVRWSAVLLNLN